MIEYLNNKIHELIDKTDGKSMVEFNKAVLIRRGYQNRHIDHDDVRDSLGEYAIEAYLKGQQIAISKENT